MKLTGKLNGLLFCHNIGCSCHNLPLFLGYFLPRKLQELDLLERLAGDVLTTLIHKRIESHVQETCKGSFDVSHIGSLEVVGVVLFDSIIDFLCSINSCILYNNCNLFCSGWILLLWVG